MDFDCCVNDVQTTRRRLAQPECGVVPRAVVALPDMVRIIGDTKLQRSFQSGQAVYLVLATAVRGRFIPEPLSQGMMFSRIQHRQ